MFNTITITSKDRPVTKKRIKLSSLTDYQIETVTIEAGTLEDMLFNVDAIDSNMHEMEDTAIYDFLNFEKMD